MNTLAMKLSTYLHARPLWGWPAATASPEWEKICEGFEEGFEEG